MSIQISHEVPFALLNDSRSFNDYDYALVHLFEEHSEYLHFFFESLEQGRKVILDNSVFELEEAFDADRFAYWINQLKPTEYIVPDVLDDASGTIASLESWISDYDWLPGKTIGVVQGKTLGSALSCYEQIAPLVDKVAVSFNCKFYEEMFPDDSKLIAWMKGRQRFMERIAHHPNHNPNQPFHLLGCSYMAEFKHYKQPGFEFIETLDTSNPIVFALSGVECSKSGVDVKISTKLIEFINTSYDDIDYELVNKNVKTFRSFVSG